MDADIARKLQRRLQIASLCLLIAMLLIAVTATMNPMNALLFLVTGLSVLLLRQQSTATTIYIGNFLAVAIGLIAAWRLMAIQNILSVMTTACFLLISIALLTFRSEKAALQQTTQIIILIVFLLSLFYIMGYLY